MPDKNCPQCRSENVVDRGALAGFECDYCSNEWYEIDASTVAEEITPDHAIQLDAFANPLPVSEVNGTAVDLEGNGGAIYRLYIYADGTATLKRRARAYEGYKWVKTGNNHVGFEIVEDE